MWEEQSILCYPTHKSCFKMDSIIFISTHSNYLFLEIKLTECQDLVYRTEIIYIILGHYNKGGTYNLKDFPSEEETTEEEGLFSLTLMMAAYYTSRDARIYYY